MDQRDYVRRILEDLTGQNVPFEPPDLSGAPLFGDNDQALGYSQLHELLLLYGLDRVTPAFFAFLRTGATDYTPGDGFDSLGVFEEGVQRFRKMALLLYGNVKFAFKTLSTDPDLLAQDLESLAEVREDRFAQRHHPILPVKPIAPDEAYLTGYLIEGELRRRLDDDPSDGEAQALDRRRQAIVKEATENQKAYLASDHLDVYVATSMRERHEFLSISHLVDEIFGDSAVKNLNLRWFDPTQAYCASRIDKGLAEALMLRRAKCTIYLAQELDTLGKDSELASTLAQGKPVIAYVPEADEEFLANHFKNLQRADPGSDLPSLLLEQLRVFDPNAAWRDQVVRKWCDEPESADLTELKKRLSDRIRAHYDRRATTLKESHPLGIQVNLTTGVANGVLVVRNARDCARLVRAIVTQTLDFDLETSPESKDVFLREKISGSIFRVMTGDAMLTNTFWNYYLEPAE